MTKREHAGCNFLSFLPSAHNVQRASFRAIRFSDLGPFYFLCGKLYTVRKEMKCSGETAIRLELVRDTTADYFMTFRFSHSIVN